MARAIPVIESHRSPWRSLPSGCVELSIALVLFSIAPGLRLRAQTAVPPRAAAAAPAPAPAATGTPAAAPTVAELNGMLTTARADIKAGNEKDAIDLMDKATTARPDIALLWITYGDAWTSMGYGLAHGPNPLIVQDSKAFIDIAYRNAAEKYQKALSLNPPAATAGPVYCDLGNAQANLGQTQDAVDSFEKAVAASPENAKLAYFNETAALFNAYKGGQGNLAAAVVTAADKAIAADAGNAVLYYMKLKGLAATGTTANSPNRAAMVEAGNHYLELAPTGPFAGEVKGILAGGSGAAPRR
ncbi:MAG TPA: tetratricopeptide repeat protein [Acidobacteriaceae bacterium]